MYREPSGAVEPAAKRRVARGPGYFLVIGNGRTGSTWLETTLDQLSDVKARLELKPRLAYQKPHPTHIYVDRSTRSIEDCILSACDTQPVDADAHLIYGSKLIFDPYGYLDPPAFDFLGKLIGDDVPTILLKRNYAAQFHSWKVRGVFHKLNPDAIAHLADFDRTFVENVTRQWQDQTEPRPRRISLTRRGAPLAGNLDDDAPHGSLHYPLEDAVEDLLVLFYNDLNALKLARRSCRHLVIDYDEIASRLAEVVDFLGSSASEAQIRASLQRPVTNRLRVFDRDHVQPAGIIDSFSDCLAQAFSDAATDGAPDDVWRWHDGRDRIELAIPAFGDLLDRHDLREERTVSPVGDIIRRGIRWRRRRPGSAHGGVQWQRRRRLYALR